MSRSTSPQGAFRRVLRWIVASRFLSFSILLHTVIVLILGGLVLTHVSPARSDFEAGNEGILAEAASLPQPSELPRFDQGMEQSVAPKFPSLSTPLSAMITAARFTPTVKIVPNAPVRGLSDSMRGALTRLGNRNAPPASAASVAPGNAGSSRSAMIFGQRVTASRLGVILDVSSSAHSHLASAVDEIQKAFSDAVLILYPGCGLMAYEGSSGHEIRKFSSIPRNEFDSPKDYFSTSWQVSGALKVNEFAFMTTRTSLRDTLFVSWYAPSDAKGTSNQCCCRTQSAFEDLMKRGVDAIYWFADFEDTVEPPVVERLGLDLRIKRIKLHVHNFAGKVIDPAIVDLAEKTGGTISVSKPN